MRKPNWSKPVTRSNAWWCSLDSESFGRSPCGARGLERDEAMAVARCLSTIRGADLLILQACWKIFAGSRRRRSIERTYHHRTVKGFDRSLVVMIDDKNTAAGSSTCASFAGRSVQSAESPSKAKPSRVICWVIPRRASLMCTSRQGMTDEDYPCWWILSASRAAACPIRIGGPSARTCRNASTG